MTRDERLARLEHQLHQQTGLCNDLLEQIAELNLKMRFALSLMRVRKQSRTSIIDPASGAPKLELMDGYIAYLTGGRDMIAAVIEAEIAEAERHMAEAEKAGAPYEAENSNADDGSGPQPDREGSGEGSGGSSVVEGAFGKTGDPSETRH